jgi:hypothetical protein
MKRKACPIVGSKVGNKRKDAFFRCVVQTSE